MQQPPLFIGMLITFVIPTCGGYLALTILTWAMPDPQDKNRTLVQLLASQWRFVRDLMRRIY